MDDEEWNRRQGQNIALGFAVAILIFFIALVLFVTGTVKIGLVEWYVIIMLVGAFFSVNLMSKGYDFVGFICLIMSVAWPAVISIVARMIIGR